MHVAMVTSAKTPGRMNEDFVGAVPGAVVLLDGAGIPGIDAIDQLASEHRDTCDIADPSSPQATVAIYRTVGDQADDLVLAD